MQVMMAFIYYLHIGSSYGKLVYCGNSIASWKKCEKQSSGRPGPSEELLII